MGKVKFGWRVPDFPVDGSPSNVFRDQIYHNLVQIQDKFASAWVSDHFIPWAPWQSPAVDNLECLSTICYLAGAFPKLDFGSIVLSQSYRNPALVAKMGANLQLLTGGRFILGIGAGWKEEEYWAYGYDFPATGVRITQLEEALQIIHKLWSDDPADRPATFKGQYYQIQEAWCEPRPQPRPPILIGAGGEKRMLRIVAQYADWWNLSGCTQAEFAHKLNVLRQHCDTIGRNYAEIVKTWNCEITAVAETEVEAKRIAAASPFVHGDNLIGTPAQVAEQLQSWIDLGTEHIIMRFSDFPNPAGAQLFAEEVVPLLQNKPV